MKPKQVQWALAWWVQLELDKASLKGSFLPQAVLFSVQTPINIYRLRMTIHTQGSVSN